MKQFLLATAFCALCANAYADHTVLYERSLPNGMTQQTILGENGHLWRYIPEKVNPLSQQQVARRAESSERVITFYESFEDYDISFGLNWIPQDWSKINTPANTPTEVQISHNINNSWYVYTTSDFFQKPTPDGNCEAFIHFAYDGDYGVVDADQDEWLVSPEIAVGKEQTLHFLLQSDFFNIYDGGVGYFDFNEIKYLQRVPVCNMQVMATTDGGENWTCIWDLEQDVASKMTDFALYYGDNLGYLPYSVEMGDFAGKNVKLAFRYTRKKGPFNGASMFIDGVVLDQPEDAGISDIEIDNQTETEYFNLQGVRVSNPESGNVYIRRNGSAVDKILF